jgi:hypothetical protein
MVVSGLLFFVCGHGGNRLKCVIAQRQLHSRSANRRIARVAGETSYGRVISRRASMSWLQRPERARDRPLILPQHGSLPVGVGAGEILVAM